MNTIKTLESIQDVMEATTADLVQWYNDKTGSAIKKFADRKTAERRCCALLAGNEEEPKVEPPKRKVATSFPAAEPKKSVRKPTKVASKATQTKKAPSAKRKPKAATSLSEAQALTWLDKEVREARCERSNVSVNGTDYRSVRAAFEALGLPMSQHIKFRMKLKESVKLTEYGFKWEIIPTNY